MCLLGENYVLDAKVVLAQRGDNITEEISALFTIIMVGSNIKVSW